MDEDVENRAHNLLLNHSLHAKTTCRQCTFWEPDNDDVPNDLKATHGLCTKAVFYTEANDLTAMITKDASMYDAQLYTRHDHSCNELTEA